MSKAAELAALIGGTSGSSLSNRNLIINGAMQVAQRGTSAATKTNIAYHTVDRFKIGPNSMGTFTHTQESDGPAGFTKSVKLECTTADASPAANDSITIQNIIEAQDLQHLNKGSSDAKSVTLSFYVKSNKTGTYTAELFEDDNSRHISKTFSVSSSGTWEYKTITFEGDTSGAMNNDNGVGFYVLWHLGAGSNFTSGTLGTSWQANDTADRVSSSNVNLADTVGNYFQLTGVQLEVGEQATPFEHRSYGDELARCQRYFEKSFPQATAPANNTSLSTVQYTNVQSGYGTWHNFNFAVPKRAAPTMTAYNPSSTTANKAVHVADNVAFTSTTLYAQAEYGFVSAIYGGSGDATGNKVGFNWDADAEL